MRNQVRNSAGLFQERGGMADLFVTDPLTLNQRSVPLGRNHELGLLAGSRSRLTQLGREMIGRAPHRRNPGVAPDPGTPQSLSDTRSTILIKISGRASFSTLPVK